MSLSNSVKIDAHRKDVDERAYQEMIGSLLYLIESGQSNMFSMWKYKRF